MEVSEQVRGALDAYVEAKRMLATLRTDRLELERTLQRKEDESERVAWGIIAQHNALPENAKARITEPMAKAQIAARVETECGGLRDLLLKKRGEVERAEAQMSAAREVLRYAYAIFALTTGHNMIAHTLADL